MSKEQSHLNGHSLAPIGDYFAKLHEEGKAEEKANKGKVWTIVMDGPAQVNVLGIASCTYNLHLNCSHVGESMYGVYRGELGMEFNGEMGGAKLILAALGIGTSEDLDGWFRNENFVMKIRPYDKEDLDGFIESFDESKMRMEEKRPELTGDEEKDAITQATYDVINKGINAFLSAFSQNEQLDGDAKESGEPSGLWYDWDFHKTDGDLGIFLKLNGGLMIYHVSGSSVIDKDYRENKVDSTVSVIFNPTMKERYTEDIVSPFPYSVMMYPDGTVKFTLYNSKGGPITVSWLGKVSSIPVEDTITV